MDTMDKTKIWPNIHFHQKMPKHSVISGEPLYIVTLIKKDLQGHPRGLKLISDRDNDITKIKYQFQNSLAQQSMPCVIIKVAP